MAHLTGKWIMPSGCTPLGDSGGAGFSWVWPSWALLFSVQESHTSSPLAALFSFVLKLQNWWNPTIRLKFIQTAHVGVNFCIWGTVVFPISRKIFTHGLVPHMLDHVFVNANACSSTGSSRPSAPGPDEVTQHQCLCRGYYMCLKVHVSVYCSHFHVAESVLWTSDHVDQGWN